MNRKSFLILLIGMIIGLTLAPLTKNSPKDAILSPITSSRAGNEEFLSPLADGVVLGATSLQYPAPSIQPPVASSSATSQFASLINEVNQENLPKPSDLPNPSIPPTPSNSPNPPSPKVYSNYSGTITIAALGDSITDLMGPELPYLKNYLKTYYPKAQFNLLNYGVGAQNIEMVEDRMTKDYDYQGKHISALTSLKPDLVIVESCAYNPFVDDGDYLNRHWTALSRVTDIIKSQMGSKILILAAIAPAKAEFGQGPAGVNWPQEMSIHHATLINQYLDNALNFAKAANLYYVDAYHPSLLANGEGNQTYINQGDHIHQNVAGDEFIAKLLASRIYNILGF